MTDDRIGPVKRSIIIAGHRTSIALEPAFWDALKTIADERGQSVSALVRNIDEARTQSAALQGLSSAIRVYILDHYQMQAQKAHTP